MNTLEAIKMWKESGTDEKFPIWDMKRRIAEKDALEQEENDEE